MRTLISVLYIFCTTLNDETVRTMLMDAPHGWINAWNPDYSTIFHMTSSALLKTPYYIFFFLICQERLCNASKSGNQTGKKSYNFVKEYMSAKRQIQASFS